VHLGHELVEVDPPAGLGAYRLEEHVHEHGFAASYATMDVKPPRAGAARPRKKTSPVGRACGKRLGELVEAPRQLRLSWVDVDLALTNAVLELG
jgi:hypothetical protein